MSSPGGGKSQRSYEEISITVQQISSAFLSSGRCPATAGNSEYFTKPIFAIKHTVDRLAENDFSARVDVLRKEVIANVSPELRSPLSVISGYAELVRDIHRKDEAAIRPPVSLPDALPHRYVLP